MRQTLQRAVEEALRARIIRTQGIGGGDINDAYEIQLSDGSRRFLKTNDHCDPHMFESEAQGLVWLRQGTEQLRIPEVLYVTPATSPPPHFLVLEMLAPTRRRPNFDEDLGRGLARLHRYGADCFGWSRDNFIGRLPQPNAPCATWPEFYAERHLQPQLEMAAAAGRATRTMRRGLEGLLSRLPELLGPPEPPARLHGDLWGGNLHVDEKGAPCLIDPAVYGGHREIDLAMMHLFGGFSARCFASYAESYPLAPGATERMPLYQLYPLMVHVNLFGGSYASSVERIVRPYA